MQYYLIQWLLMTLTLIATAHVIPGIIIRSFPAALVAALVIGVVNAFVFPILALLTLPLTIVTLGLFIFVLNGIMLKIAAALTPGFEIKGWMPAILGAIVMAVISFLIRWVFGPGLQQI